MACDAHISDLCVVVVCMHRCLLVVTNDGSYSNFYIGYSSNDMKGAPQPCKALETQSGRPMYAPFFAIVRTLCMPMCYATSTYYDLPRMHATMHMHVQVRRGHVHVD